MLTCRSITIRSKWQRQQCKRVRSMGRVAVDESEATPSTGMVFPTRQAALEVKVFASKSVWQSLMKWKVSSLMETVKWRCIVRYNKENRLVGNEGIYRTLVNSRGAIFRPLTSGVMIPDVMYHFSYYFLTSFPSKSMLVTLNLFRIWPLFPLV